MKKIKPKYFYISKNNLKNETTNQLNTIKVNKLNKFLLLIFYYNKL